MNKRQFLFGSAAVVVTAASSVGVVYSVGHAFGWDELPRIIGDGVHDDTAGLQAALDGRPFLSSVVKRVGNVVHLSEGTYYSTATLYLRDAGLMGVRRDHVPVSRIRGAGDGPVLHAHYENSWVQDLYLKHEGCVDNRRYLFIGKDDRVVLDCGGAKYGYQTNITGVEG